MKRKILIVGNNSNGMYLFRGMLISELVKQGNEVVVLTPFDLNVDDIRMLGVRLYETPIDRRGMDPLKDLKLIRLYKNIIKAEKPDLVVTYTIKPNIYAGYICSKYNITYAANITGLGSVFQSVGVVRSVIVQMYRKALKKAKVVFFENRGNQITFIKEKIIEETKTVVLNGAGVDTQFFYYAEYPNEDTVRFLFSGRIMAEKGIDELLNAINRLRTNGYNVFLDIIGEYDEWKYKEIIDSYEKDGFLKFYGYQDDVRPFIEKCNCFVLPSWHEGMANTNLECASMGRPVITTNIHGCKEAIENNISGFLCDKKNSDDLYEKMKQFTELSYKERRAMGLAGRERMEKFFDKKKVVEETINQLYYWS